MMTQLRRCNLRNGQAVLSPRGVWLPWDDHEAHVAELRKAARTEADDLRRSLRETAAREVEFLKAHVPAEMLEKAQQEVDELRRKLANARSQISKLKKKDTAGVT
jgi:phytoene dehydrogenase-like protein